MLRPRIAILDELDSGLDIDALRDCARRVEDMSNDTDGGEHSACWRSRTTTGCSTELRPDHVHILVKGRIVASGGAELADQLEIDGYAAFVPDADLHEPSAPAAPWQPGRVVRTLTRAA